MAFSPGEIRRPEFIAFDNSITGIRTFGRPDFITLVANTLDNELDVIEGSGQVAVMDTDTGISQLTPVDWPNQTIAAEDIPFTDGNIIVVIDINGDVDFIFNNNQSVLNREDFIIYIELGAVTLVSGQIIQAGTGVQPIYGLAYNFQNLVRALGYFNYAGDERILVEGNADSTFKMSTGLRHGLLGGADPRFAHSFERLVPLDPMPALITISSRTGAFAFSAGAAADVDQYDAVGTIKEFKAEGGNTEFQTFEDPFNESDIGKSITITNTTNYNGTFTILDVPSNDKIVIGTSFVGDDATGDWQAVIDVGEDMFTTQRIMAFASGILAEYYGLEQYDTFEAAEAARSSEFFIEAGVTAAAFPVWELIIKQGTVDLTMENTSEIKYLITSRIKN